MFPAQRYKASTILPEKNFPNRWCMGKCCGLKAASTVCATVSLAGAAVADPRAMLFRTMKNLLMRGSKGADVARLRAELARQLGNDAADFPGLAKGDVLDAACEAAIRRWQSGVGLIADGVIGPLCQSLLGLRATPALQVAASFESAPGQNWRPPDCE